MLQRNGPEPQENVEVIDNTPRDQCLYCGCLTRQSRCPECGASLGAPGHASSVRRKAVVGFIPSPQRLYAVDKKVGEQWFPVSHNLAASESEAVRNASAAFNIPEGVELRVTPMMGGVPITWKRVPVVELPSENEAVEVGDEGGDGF